MEITAKQIRHYRLQAQHLDQKLAPDKILAAAAVCGLQNTPPGAWESALFNRLENISLQALNGALYGSKILLQAWSYRGVPLVFPSHESAIFLSPLIAQPGEEPWIYTRGISAALDFLQMDFDDLLARLKAALSYLDEHSIKSKEMLDQSLAAVMRETLPQDKQARWDAPSMYGKPEQQSVGGAVVSFLLRPCSFASLIVFGERQGSSPSFSSFRNWTGHSPTLIKDADRQLTRKFLHAFGPSTIDHFMNWLGCSKAQARRLWNSAADEMEPVRLAGKTLYILSSDRQALSSARLNDKTLLLLGPHDPYLDLRDRSVILEDKSLQKRVWQFVANPGVVLQGGRVIGLWKSKTNKDKIDISVTCWETLSTEERSKLRALAEAYANFRLLRLQNYSSDES